MKYSLDKPIQREQEDLLNRKDFAKHFAKDVIMLSEKNNFTATITANFTDGNFDISVIDNKGEKIVSFDYDKYVSQEGGT